MLNRSLKKSAIDRYEQTVKQYDKTVEDVQSQAIGLHELRQESSKSAIEACEAYVNTLANSPKEFNKSISEFKIEYGKFTKLLIDLQRENAKHEVIGGSLVGAGAAMGVGVAALGPSAAMAVATTFGVASTGTAISALSGAAATNAALAWIGGGALTAGGAGMAGGSAVLALTGPVGWGIAGAGLVVGGVTMSRKNAQVAEKATKATVEVQAGIALLKTAEAEVQRLTVLTVEHSDGITRLLERLRTKAPQDYLAFSQEDKHTLAALINNVQALSKLLNKKVE